MANSRFVLAYCLENKVQAQAIDQQLSASGLVFDHLSCGEGAEKAFSYRLTQASDPILLLLSDNLLKSIECMDNLYSAIQQLLRNRRLTTLVIDGIEVAEHGALTTRPTQFDRVSHVIQYMNYWQDKYLEARKEKRDVPAEEEAAFNERLKTIRSISSDIGEFLRFLRNADYYHYEKLAENDFNGFFTVLQIEHLRSAYLSSSMSGKDAMASAINATVETAPSGSVSEEEKTAPVTSVEEPEPVEVEDSSPPPADPEQEEAGEQARSQEEEGHEPEREEKEVEEAMSEEEAEVQSVEEVAEDEEAEPREVDSLAYGEDENDNWDVMGKLDALFEEEEAADIPSAEIAEEEEEDLWEEDLWEEEEEEEEVEVSEETDRHELSIEDEKIERIAQSANYLIQTGEVDQGISLLRTLVKNHPENAALRYKFANTLLHQGYADEAEQQMESLLEHQPDFAPAYLRLSELAEQKEDYLLAKNYLEKAESLDSDLKGLYYQLGLLVQQYFPEQKEEAAQYFKKALKRDKKNVDAHYRYAMLLNEMGGKEKKAIRHFKKTLKINPQHPFANYDLALLYHQEQDWEEAAHFYNRAVKVNPELKTDQNDKAFGIHLTPEQRKRKQRMAASPFRMPSEWQPVVWITGATSGIGRATAEIFARHGCKLILSGRRESRLEAIKSDFEQQYQNEVLLLSFDVQDPEAVQKACASLEGEWQEVDILINNAGLAKGLASIHEGDLDHWNTMIDTNIKGLLFMTRMVSPGMVDRGRGHIINVCSIAGKEVYPKGNVYSATKHAVDALTRAMRLDLHQHGLRVSQVSPGHVEETEFALTRFDGDEEKARIYEDFQPLTSADVAEAIFFLATRPPHVDIQDILMTGTQQANATTIDRSGR